MEANGVRSVLVGNTDIKKGITTTTFASTPDVPVSSITVNLPIGAHSALAANGNLCANPLVMPTTMTGQNGTVVKQNTTIKVNTCGVRVVGHKIVGNTAYITVQTFAAGRISGKGASVATRFRKLAKAALPGGDMDVSAVAALTAELMRDYPFLTQAHASRLAHAYGTRACKLLGTAKSLGDLGQPFGATLTESEVQYLMSVEWACTAEDVIWRRSKLGLRLSRSEIAALDDWMAAHRLTPEDPLMEAGART